MDFRIFTIDHVIKKESPAFRIYSTQVNEVIHALYEITLAPHEFIRLPVLNALFYLPTVGEFALIDKEITTQMEPGTCGMYWIQEECKLKNLSNALAQIIIVSIQEMKIKSSNVVQTFDSIGMNTCVQILEYHRFQFVLCRIGERVISKKIIEGLPAYAYVISGVLEVNDRWLDQGESLRLLDAGEIEMEGMTKENWLLLIVNTNNLS